MRFADKTMLFFETKKFCQKFLVDRKKIEIGSFSKKKRGLFLTIIKEEGRKFLWSHENFCPKDFSKKFF